MLKNLVDRDYFLKLLDYRDFFLNKFYNQTFIVHTLKFFLYNSIEKFTLSSGNCKYLKKNIK